MSNKKKGTKKGKHGDRAKVIKGPPYNKGKLDSILYHNRHK
jgi:hypothetical protein